MFRSRSSRTGAVLVATLLSSAVAQAQTVDEIITRNLQARGGVERLKALNTAKITGSVLQQGSTIRIVTWAKRPNLMRREMQPLVPPAAAGAMGRGGMPERNPELMKAVVAFDGSTVWTLNPMAGNAPQRITGPQAEMAKDNADFDSVLLDYKANGHRVELVGTESIAGKPAHHLKITKKNGQVQHYYFDVSTSLEVRTSTTIEQDGVKAEVVTDLSNYQTVSGLTMPFSMRQSVNGETVAQVTIESWEVNVPVDDQIFKMPAKG